MSLVVPLSLERRFRVAASPESALALLADVPRWADLFPGAETVEPAPEWGAGAYRWTLAPMGPPGYAVRTTYACRYTADPDALTLDWRPVPNVGNAEVEGAVRLRPDGDGAAGTLRLRMALSLPVPGFARALVVPAVTLAFGRMTDTFIERVQGALEAGRGNPSP